MNQPKCEHTPVAYRFESVEDGDENSSDGRYTTWSCNRRECIEEAALWTFVHEVFVYTRDHKPISLEEALKGAK